MATRIKLDLDPSDNLDFERAVSIPTPTGKPLSITFTFKYRDRVAMARLFDEYLARSGAEPVPDETPKLADSVRAAIDTDVATIQDLAVGWNIDAPFDADNIAKLVRKYPGAALAIVSDYRVSLTQGRLGN